MLVRTFLAYSNSNLLCTQGHSRVQLKTVTRKRTRIRLRVRQTTSLLIDTLASSILVQVKARFNCVYVQNPSTVSGRVADKR